MYLKLYATAVAVAIAAASGASAGLPELHASKGFIKLCGDCKCKCEQEQKLVAAQPYLATAQEYPVPDGAGGPGGDYPVPAA